MGVSQVEKRKIRHSWGFYLAGSISFIVTILLAAAVVYYRVYFWEEVHQVQAYGYVGGFVISILGGITIVPVPSLLVIFTLGGVLNPFAIGLISGFGEALGSMTIYMTGAGIMETVWARIRHKQQSSEHHHNIEESVATAPRSPFWVKSEAFYNRLVLWIGGHGGALAIIFVAAIPLSPFYFAGLAAGSLRMGLLRFFLASWAGKTIRGMIVAYAGYGGLYFLLQWIGA